DRFEKPFLAVIGDWVAPVCNLTVISLELAQEKLEDCRLAGTGPADNPQRLPFFQCEPDITECRAPVFGEPELTDVEGDVPFGCQIRRYVRIPDVGPDGQELTEPAVGRPAALDDVEQEAECEHRPDKQTKVRVEGDQVPERHVTAHDKSCAEDDRQ